MSLEKENKNKNITKENTNSAEENKIKNIVF